MSEHRVRNIVRQVVAGAEALEKASIFHMDLWSANWLIDVEDNDRVKIIDFGVAAITDERVNEMPLDFPIVMPEFLTTKSARPSSFAPWAMSLCIFSLIFKREAFGLNRDFSNIIDRREQILALHIGIPDDATHELRDYLTSTLAYEHVRLNISQLASHAWLNIHHRTL